MVDRSNTERGVGALRSLIELTAPVDELQAALPEPPPAAADAPAPAATLTRDDVISVLDRYLSGDLDHGECVRWAAALRVRRDLGMEAGHDQMLRALLFEMASPHLFRPMSPRFAERWRRRLADPLPHPPAR